MYGGRVKLPVEGEYDIAFMMDTPSFLHCFTTMVEPNPELQNTTAKLAIEFQVLDRRVPVGEPVPVRFRLTDPRTLLPRSDIPDVAVMSYRSDGRGRRIVPAKPLGDGVYEAEIRVGSTSTWYVFVGARSAEVGFSDLPFLSLMGVPAPATADASAGAEKEQP